MTAETSRYFAEQVLRKRPYLTIEMCMAVIASLLRVDRQPDRRVRYWGRITLPNEAEPRILRVVTLEDGTTIHNAFLVRDFRPEAS